MAPVSLRVLACLCALAVSVSVTVPRKRDRSLRLRAEEGVLQEAGVQVQSQLMPVPVKECAAYRTAQQLVSPACQTAKDKKGTCHVRTAAARPAGRWSLPRSHSSRRARAVHPVPLPPPPRSLPLPFVSLIPRPAQALELCELHDTRNFVSQMKDAPRHSGMAIKYSVKLAATAMTAGAGLGALGFPDEVVDSMTKTFAPINNVPPAWAKPMTGANVAETTQEWVAQTIYNMAENVGEGTTLGLILPAESDNGFNDIILAHAVLLFNALELRHALIKAHEAGSISGAALSPADSAALLALIAKVPANMWEVRAMYKSLHDTGMKAIALRIAATTVKATVDGGLAVATHGTYGVAQLVAAAAGIDASVGAVAAMPLDLATRANLRMASHFFAIADDAAAWLKKVVHAGGVCKALDTQQSQGLGTWLWKVAVKGMGYSKATSEVEKAWKEHTAARDAVAPPAAEDAALDVFMSTEDTKCAPYVVIAEAIQHLGFDATATAALQLQRYKALSKSLAAKAPVPEAEWDAHLSHKSAYMAFSRVPAAGFLAASAALGKEPEDTL